MTPRYLRIVFFSEFLLAVIAIFTAWSEIGGQAVLDAMPWGWKSGLGLGLAAVCVAYSVALASADSVWNTRTAKWLALILVLVGAMGVVTFYYALQVQNEPPDEQDTSATFRSSGESPAPSVSPHRKFV
jgi:drug/metabolite transporter (DMT)-like permease